MSRDYHSEPINPASMRELRALVRLHGANRIIAACDEIVREELDEMKRQRREREAEALARFAKDFQK